MPKTHHLTLPVDRDAIRALELGDLVFIDGEIVMTAGLPTHKRILEAMDGKRELPFPLDGAALFHLGSYSVDTPDGFEILYMNPTTSTRFNPVMPAIIRHFGLTLVCGKGGLDAASAEAMREVGCVYLSILGGGAALHSDAIRKVVDVGWTDLVSHYRMVKMQVEGLGPLTVEIDAHGHNGYDLRQQSARDRLPALLAEMNAARG
ncbi:fumarate hydratase C-terminal domain-containing protein [Mangrovibrevibacter kandeliae]|uniref:fumarate hydratase C-terminal domain-containing protein n=1 Tax=Mangrovibrevibacter kandeliae TaxID=2968473 RepID=UPI00211900BF|nr:fumarate hydratase C-terminal domain-containing protein [Aurantimonas sp. CSK15Z-1]MCQ8781879.1 fumarate hydratase C-terminal domain-containing protein [Aurantimonas sp. CSK15Z-1]